MCQKSCAPAAGRPDGPLPETRASERRRKADGRRRACPVSGGAGAGSSVCVIARRSKGTATTEPSGSAAH
jgi:hypothetical protein